MKLIRETTEDTMIATFLGGEYTSARFGDQVTDALRKLNIKDSVITHPDLTSTEENNLRRQLLREARGYGSGDSWFAGWPAKVQWYEAELERQELVDIRYIVYSYWIELTKGTLRAGDSVKTIRNAEEIYGVSSQPLIDLAKIITTGKQLPPMIVVGKDAHDLVVVEGHSRLTGYVLAGDKAPSELPAIVGLSPAFADWKMYSFEAHDRH